MLERHGEWSMTKYIPAALTLSAATSVTLLAVSCADSRKPFPWPWASSAPERVLSPSFWVVDFSLSAHNVRIRNKWNQLRTHQAEEHLLLCHKFPWHFQRLFRWNSSESREWSCQRPAQWDPCVYIASSQLETIVLETTWKRLLYSNVTERCIFVEG